MSIPNLYGSGSGVSEGNKNMNDPAMIVNKFRSAVPFVVTEATAYLSDERVLTAGDGILVTIDTSQSPATTVTIALDGSSYGTLSEIASKTIFRDINGGFSAYQPTFIAQATAGSALVAVVDTPFTTYAVPVVSHGFTSFASGILTIAQSGTYFVSATAFCASAYTFWTMHTSIGGGAGSPAAPSLGTAANFEILAASTITTSSAATLSPTANLGLYPGTSVTGSFNYSSGGSAHVNDSTAQTAQIDALAAFTALNAMTTSPGGDLSAGGILGGLTLYAGVYSFSSTAGLTGTLTLDGQSNPNAVFVIKVGSSLTTAASSVVLLTNGAVPENVFWTTGSFATLGASSTFVGTLIATTAITFPTPVVIFTGRAISLTTAITFAGAGATFSNPFVGLPSSAPSLSTLGTASTFQILANTTITTVGPALLPGSLGLNSAGAVTGEFTFLSGAAHLNDSVATAAQVDALAAFTSLAAMATSGGGDLTALGDIGGLTLDAGVYSFSSTAGLTGTLILDGQSDPNAVFVIKIGSSLTTAASSVVTLINGAIASNVFWVVGTGGTGSATLGASSTFVGNLIAKNSITFPTPIVSFTGRAFALTGAVTFAGNGATFTSPLGGGIPDSIRYTQGSGVLGTANEASSFIVCFPGDKLEMWMRSTGTGITGTDGATQTGMLQVVKLF